MALETTTGTLIRQYNAFTGLSATERSQSGIARAEVVYYNVNDNWPAAAAGNNRIYQTGTLDLPKDFGYVLTDVFVMIRKNNSSALYTNANSVLQLFPGGSLGPQINMNVPSEPDRQDSAASTPIGDIPANQYNLVRPFGSDDAVMIYSLVNKPTSIIYPFGSQTYTTTPNPASQFNWQVGEQFNGGGVYTCLLYTSDAADEL